MLVEIRRLAGEEVELRADQLLELLDRALAQSPVAANRADEIAYIDGRLRQATAYRNQHLVTAESLEGALHGLAIGGVGAATTRLPAPAEREHPGFAAEALFVLWLAVDPGARRRGLGSKLLDHLQRTAHAPRAWLHVDRSNEPAVSLYEQLGWSLLGQTGSRLIYGRVDRAR